MSAEPVRGGPQADFQEESVGVDQVRKSLARSQLSVAVLLFDLLRATTVLELVFEFLDIAHEPAHAVGRSVGHHSMLISCISEKMRAVASANDPYDLQRFVKAQ